MARSKHIDVADGGAGGRGRAARGRAGRAPGRARLAGRAPAAHVRRVRRPARPDRQPPGQRPGGARAGLAARPLPVRRAARPRQDHAGPRHRERARRRPPRHQRPGHRPQGHAGLAPDLARRARRAVHRRDPSAGADRRGEPLPGDGGLQVRPVHRRRAPRQGGHDEAAAVHAARRHHPDGPPVGAAARPVRLPLAAPLLRPHRHDRDRAALGPSDRGADRRRGRAEIARRSRGTPRIGNRLLRRVRDFAAVEGDGGIDGALAASALDRLAVDHAGLDALDRGYLSVVCERFDGGPVGIEAIAASLSARSAAPSRRSSSRSCSRSASSPGPRAAGSRPPPATATSA